LVAAFELTIAARGFKNQDFLFCGPRCQQGWTALIWVPLSQELFHLCGLEATKINYGNLSFNTLKSRFSAVSRPRAESSGDAVYRIDMVWLLSTKCTPFWKELVALHY